MSRNGQRAISEASQDGLRSVSGANLFRDALSRSNAGRPPVWFMRQAGRYHSHYQKLRARHSFMELCKVPEIACEATMGPIEDFGFDAAILFSDLLFPLEAMGMGLRYEPGPKLDWHLDTPGALKKLGEGAVLAKGLDFQAKALRLIRDRLDSSKGLLGFVGGPLTLYGYAVEGSHHGKLASAREGFYDGRFKGFCAKLTELLAANMALQAEAGVDTVAVFDTGAGEFGVEAFRDYALPALQAVLAEFRGRCPDVPVVYYSKGTGPAHWSMLADLPIEGLGIDWNHKLADVLTEFGGRFAIQGNVDPEWLFLDARELEKRLREVFASVERLPSRARRGWICGLGHGVLQGTPEENVRLFLKLQREMFEVL